MRAARRTEIDEFLREMNIDWQWLGISALDRYYRGSTRATSYGNAPEYTPHEHIAIMTDLTALAASGADVDFPGIEGIDCILSHPDWDSDLYVVLRESPDAPMTEIRDFYGRNQTYESAISARKSGEKFIVLPESYDIIRKKRFIGEIRADKALGTGDNPAQPEILSNMTEAALLARYSIGEYAKPVPPSINEGIECAFTEIPQSATANLLPPAQWRYWFDIILSGVKAHLGLDFLMCTGILTDIFPELAGMRLTAQHKDHHPEGNVWRHTVETLKYRKDTDLRLAYALLLHDSGKPEAVPRGGKRFDRHAQIGARRAATVLERLGHSRGFIDDVLWLVENHGYPSALGRLPQQVIDPLMSDRRFPLLLELYRCDISASYSGPENYYAACDVYNRYRKDMGLKRFRPVH